MLENKSIGLDKNFQVQMAGASAPEFESMRMEMASRANSILSEWHAMNDAGAPKLDSGAFSRVVERLGNHVLAISQKVESLGVSELTHEQTQAIDQFYERCLMQKQRYKLEYVKMDQDSDIEMHIDNVGRIISAAGEALSKKTSNTNYAQLMSSRYSDKAQQEQTSRGIEIPEQMM